MSETPRPVRAWAEYDDYTEVLDADGDGLFMLWEIPTTGTGRLWADTGRYTSVPAAVEDSAHGPLRSLRILLSTGHTLIVQTTDGLAFCDLFGSLMVADDWERCNPDYERCNQPMHSWTVQNQSDTDAVTRALAEAVAWVEQEGVTT